MTKIIINILKLIGVVGSLYFGVMFLTFKAFYVIGYFVSMTTLVVSHSISVGNGSESMGKYSINAIETPKTFLIIIIALIAIGAVAVLVKSVIEQNYAASILIGVFATIILATISNIKEENSKREKIVLEKCVELNSKKQFVYIISNPSMPGIIKIGKTKNSVNERVDDLFSTSIPTPFEINYTIETHDSDYLESELHKHFGGNRIHPRREFFRLEKDIAFKTAVIFNSKIEDYIKFQKSKASKKVTNQNNATSNYYEKKKNQKKLFVKPFEITSDTFLVFTSNPLIPSCVQILPSSIDIDESIKVMNQKSGLDGVFKKEIVVNRNQIAATNELLNRLNCFRIYDEYNSVNMSKKELIDILNQNKINFEVSYLSNQFKNKNKST
jgi:hypothetical protein